jgi:hypothetical protein
MASEHVTLKRGQRAARHQANPSPLSKSAERNGTRVVLIYHPLSITPRNGGGGKSRVDFIPLLPYSRRIRSVESLLGTSSGLCIRQPVQRGVAVAMSL